MDHNRWHGIGRLTKSPVYHPQGRRGEPHCTFILAINRVVPNEKGPVADYIPCSLWGEQAQRFVENRDKGDEVGVIGRLRINYVQQADGSSLPMVEVRVEEVHLGRKSLKNLQPKPKQTPATAAVGNLAAEFGE